MKDQVNNSDWSPCSGGEVAGLVDSLTAEERSQNVWRASSAVMATAILVVAVVMISKSLFRENRFNYGKISCADVSQALPQYEAGEVSGKLAGRIRQHRLECSHGGPRHDALKVRQITSDVNSHTVAMFDHP